MTAGGLFDLDEIPTAAPDRPGDPFLKAQRRAAVDEPRTLVRNDHRDTAKAAAVKALGRSGGARRRVFDLIGQYSHGLTDEQIQTKLAMNPSTQRPRRVELVDAGLIEDSGRRRMTESGTQAAVWVLSQAGREVAR